MVDDDRDPWEGGQGGLGAEGGRWRGRQAWTGLMTGPMTGWDGAWGGRMEAGSQT